MAKAKAPHVRRVRSKEDRKRPSVFTRLKTEESFKGHALFEPDPEVENNPGYFEYYDHWDQQGQQYVPCAGDQCPFCHGNDNPSTRALTVWYFPDADKGEQMKIFTANYSTINALADESEDEDGILGRKMRIKRLSDKGEYRVKTLSEKALSKTEVKKLLAEAEELNLEGLVDKQLAVQLERLKAVDALEDDDDDEDEDEAPKRRTGKAIAEVDEDDEDEDEEDDEDEEEESEEDEDEDEDEEDEDEDEEAEAEEIEAESYTVAKVNESEETIDLISVNDETKLKMWFGDGVEWDADELTKGTVVQISAATDDEGDWVITELEVTEAAPKAKRGRPKGSGSKGKAKAAPKGKGKTKK